MNEQLLLEQVRQDGPLSRADLARLSGLSKPTVALALANLENDGLLRVAGRRTGMRGPAAVLYEIRPEAGYVLGLDIGREFIRGALADLSGAVRAKVSQKAHASTTQGRLAELAALSDVLTASAGVTRAKVTQTVIGSPGVYDPEKGALTMAHNLPGWEQPLVLTELRRLFGRATVIENDVDVAALAERDHGHGREVERLCLRVGRDGPRNGTSHRGQAAPRRTRCSRGDWLLAALERRGRTRWKPSIVGHWKWPPLPQLLSARGTSRGTGWSFCQTHLCRRRSE